MDVTRTWALHPLRPLGICPFCPSLSAALPSSCDFFTRMDVADDYKRRGNKSRLRVHAIWKKTKWSKGRVKCWDGNRAMLEITIPNSVWLATVLTVLLPWLFHLYYSSAFSYWTKRGIYSPKPLPLFGNLRDNLLLRKRFSHALSDIYLETEGHKFVGIYNSATPILILRDLELIKCVMLKDFQNFTDRFRVVKENWSPLSVNLSSAVGSEWRNLRVKLTHLFTSGKMKMMCELMRECSEEMVSLLQDSAAREEDLEMKEVVAKFATDVIGSCAFGLQMNTMKDPNSRFRAIGKKMFTPNTLNFAVRVLGNFAPILLKLFPVQHGGNETSEFFLRTVRKVISYRKKNEITRNDFLQLLLNLKNSESDKENSIENNNFNQISGKTHSTEDLFEWTENHIVAHCIMFFGAGFETTSTGISCCLYELAMNMDIQRKFIQEIDSVLRIHKGEFTYEALQEMKYMDQVIDETLRKYPPSAVVGRLCTKPYTIPGTNVRLEKDTVVFIPIHGLHHDPKYFPNPEKFEPDRFSEENVKSIPKFAYLPFGEGPRMCIALRFARLQMKVCLTALLSQFQFSICNKTSIPIKYDPMNSFTTAPSDVWLTIKKRPDTNKSRIFSPHGWL